MTEEDYQLILGRLNEVNSLRQKIFFARDKVKLFTKALDNCQGITSKMEDNEKKLGYWLERHSLLKQEFKDYKWNIMPLS